MKKISKSSAVTTLKLGLLIVTSAASCESSSAELITAEDWSHPRNGVFVARLPAVAAAVDQMTARPNRKLLIRYPDGEAGVLWAQELRAWLVAMGISSNRIDIVPGSAPSSISDDALELAVIGVGGVELTSTASLAEGAETPQPVLSGGGQ